MMTSPAPTASGAEARPTPRFPTRGRSRGAGCGADRLAKREDLHALDDAGDFGLGLGGLLRADVAAAGRARALRELPGDRGEVGAAPDLGDHLVGGALDLGLVVGVVEAEEDLGHQIFGLALVLLDLLERLVDLVAGHVIGEAQA